jgi:hypothetical protein
MLLGVTNRGAKLSLGVRRAIRVCEWIGIEKALEIVYGLEAAAKPEDE